MNFRTVKTDTAGTLFLNSMPGRYEAFSDCMTEIKRKNIVTIVCLTPDDEIREKSPDYRAAIERDDLPVPRIVFPIPDLGVPGNLDDFYQLVTEVAEKLKSGKNLLLHCAGGKGRTGLFAGCILNQLGLPLDLLRESGSWPDTQQQLEIMRQTERMQPRDWRKK